jgi:hypothetical protein
MNSSATGQLAVAETKEKEKVNIIVEIHIDKVTVKKLTFHQDEVSGKQIKEAAGVPIDSDLGIKEHSGLRLVTNDQIIKIKNGEHFEVLPAGTIS